MQKIGSSESEVPQQIFLGTLVQSIILVTASLIGGKLSDRSGRRKIFVAGAAIVYGFAMFVIAVASSFHGFLVGMAIGGLGFGIYAAVDLALVVDVLPARDKVAKEFGAFSIAGHCLHHRPRRRASDPRDRPRQLRPPVRRRRRLRHLAAVAILPVKRIH